MKPSSAMVFVSTVLGLFFSPFSAWEIGSFLVEQLTMRARAMAKSNPRLRIS